MKKSVAVSKLEAILAYRRTIGRGVSSLCSVVKSVSDRITVSERAVTEEAIQLGMILIAYRYLSPQEHTPFHVGRNHRSVHSMVGLPWYIPSEVKPKEAAILDSVWGQAIKDIKQLRQADIDWLMAVWQRENRVVPYSKFIATCPRVGNAMVAGHAQAKVRKQVVEVVGYPKLNSNPLGPDVSQQIMQQALEQENTNG